MSRIITVANQKGGSGKTATVAALASAAAKDGKKVLAIDLDPQGNLTYTMGADTHAGSSYNLLNSEAGVLDLKQESVFGADIIPASWSLQGIVTKVGSAWRLRNVLEPVKEAYDLIIVDTPPTPGELQYNALLASTDLIIPIPADVYGLQGLFLMADTAAHLQESNPDLAITGVIVTRFTSISSLSRQMETVIRSKTEEMGIPYLGSIREAVAVREAAATKAGLYDYAPKSKPAKDYLQVYKKLF